MIIEIALFISVVVIVIVIVIVGAIVKSVKWRRDVLSHIALSDQL